MNSQCLYCHHVLDNEKVLDYPIIERSVPSQTPPIKTPIKLTLQDMLMTMDKNSLLREADRHRSLSQEMKCLGLIQQGHKMICIQGESIEMLGASSGAVVIVKVDYHAASHAIGIVGVNFQMKTNGVVRIATLVAYCHPPQGKVSGGFHLTSKY